MNILMCRPDFFDVCYQINPWMTQLKKVDKPLALKQWQHLHDTLQKCGATIHLIKPMPDNPDMVFTANAGIITKNKKVYISTFRYPERQAESIYFATWFGEQTNWHLQTNARTDLYFEGQGDALWLDNTLIAGHGFRTQPEIYATMDLNHDYLLAELVDPRFYHLDTCFCPLDANHALWWPSAFSEETQQKFQNLNIELFAVPENELINFACNTVVLGKQVVMPSGSPVTMAALQGWGYHVQSCEMSEFLKAGGACKCLTLIL